MNVLMQGVTKTYGRGILALNGVDLEIPTGMFGLLGPNGAGKTTLMRILAGILHPSGGMVRIDGRAIHTEADRAAVKRVLGYLPQELGLYPDLSAREFLDYVALLKGLDDAATRNRRVGELLETVALTEVAERKLKTFSGGMKRRVGIAQALLNDPRLLIVDEPTAGLDPEERIRFRNLLAEAAGDRTVLLSTHIVEDVAQTCRDMAVLSQGLVVFRGTVSELIEHAQGHVWNLTSAASGPRPDGDFTIVSMLQTRDNTHYHIVGTPVSGTGVMPAEPTLEDGYVWLMRGRHEGHTVAVH